VHGHSHSHTHALDARLAADRRGLSAAAVLIGVLLVGEVVAGLLAGSLALLADAGHMVTDAGALGLALVAATLAGRPAAGRWTYGFRRFEILAAQANGITLVLVAAWVVYSAIRRLVSPTDVNGSIVLAVALGGVAVNLAATALLARTSRRSLNVRGAYLHAATDLAAFAATALAGGLIVVTGWDRFDPLVSLLVAVSMLWAGGLLLRESGRIFLEVAPADIDPDEVGRTIAAHPHVVEVHDLHIWTVTSGFPALSAHVLVERGADCHGLRRELDGLLARRFGLTHTTLQVEHASDSGIELGAAQPRRTPLERH